MISSYLDEALARCALPITVRADGPAQAPAWVFYVRGKLVGSTSTASEAHQFYATLTSREFARNEYRHW